MIIVITLCLVYISLKAVTKNELPKKEKINMEFQGLANPKEYKESAVVEVTFIDSFYWAKAHKQL